MEIGALTSPELIFPALAGDDGREVLTSFATAVASSGRFRISAADLLARLLEREALGATAIGGGVALPHCKVPGLNRPLIAVGLPSAAGGVPMGAGDTQPVQLLFMVLSPPDAPGLHLQAMAAVARWARDRNRVRELLAQPRDSRCIHDLLLQPGAAA